MFRAFLNLESEYINKVENKCDLVEKNNLESIKNILEKNSEKGFELVTIQKFSELNDLYFFKKIEKEKKEISINDFANYDIMFDEYLQLLHAPYLEKK